MRHRIVEMIAVISFPLALGSCPGPAPDRGGEFIGSYRGTALVSVTPDGSPSALPAMVVETPVLIFRGSNSPLVIDDGQCLIPATSEVGSTMLTVNNGTPCTRYLPDGTVVLNIISGMGTIQDGNLMVTATGRFTFVGGDGGVGDGGPVMTGMGMFTFTITGIKQ
jgi:hypothetical protein